MEPGSSKLSLLCSTDGMLLRAWRALSGVRAGTITVAPAPARARVVSRPMPEYPPVTMATLPLRSMPRSVSRAVVVGPKPEWIGAWLLDISLSPHLQVQYRSFSLDHSLHWLCNKEA